MPPGEPVTDPARRRSDARSAGRDAALAAVEALAALEAGVVCVAASGDIALVNRAAERLLACRAGECIGERLGTALPALAPVEETLAQVRRDGVQRRSRVSITAGSLEVVATRGSGGSIVLELRTARGLAGPTTALRDDEASMAHVARAMASVADPSALLELLLATALAQCGAEGALVAQVHGEEIAFVAASGSAAPLRSRRAALTCGALERVIRTRATIAVDHGAALDGVVGTVCTGPTVATPLVAHDQLMGALVLCRRAGELPFAPREEKRMRIVADFAALALWKGRLAEDAQAAEQAKSNFLATVSHELRTPLTALTGYGELLADQILGPMAAAQHEIVERMRAVTHQLTLMIDEILTYSSIEAGREIVRASMVSARDLMAGAETIVDPMARQKGLSLMVAMPDPAPALCTDPDKVRQILTNLAGNAVKFTDHGGVTLSVRPDDHGHLCFAVRDTGPGINEDDQARLFQPFTQLNGGLTRRHGGTGLGLYISQRLAMLLGGRIEVESVPGNGSTFTLVLPA